MEKSKADAAMATLQSSDHKLLLDTIDKLRSKGISRYVDLPQIVVCGDQSSGKSSVLQAISGMSFPSKDNLCTRFATELILRQVPGSAEICKISIQPASDRSQEERKTLEKFQQTAVPQKLDIGELIEKAQTQMGLGKQSKTFSSDVLRIEVTGPNQPNLTIVDLPGLFRAGNKLQSTEDANIVRELVRSYMVKSLSIILAVVSAKSDFALQEVTQLAREIDSPGLRTIGLITKPDTLDAGSDSERAYLELAQNRDVHFRHGWHVLRNRDYNSRNSSNEERDRAEERFLAQGAWAALPAKHKGIVALRSRLSDLLTGQILQELPELIKTVETELKRCSLALDKLGVSRVTISAQRSYLLTASYRFASLVKESINGLYSDEFFGSAREDEGKKKRLRAAVQSTLTDFEANMRLFGSERVIVEKPRPSVAREISRSDYLNEVKTLMRTSKGCELPGLYNPSIVGDLFQEQIKPWTLKLNRFSGMTFEAIRYTMDSALSHVLDEKTKTTLWKEIVLPGLIALKATTDDKVAEIMASHKTRHPITYNHYLVENIQKAQQERMRSVLRARLLQIGDGGGYIRNCPIDTVVNAVMETQTETDMELFAANAATDAMDGYYKVALKRVIDDFSDLAIESCLVSKIPTILNPDRIDVLSDEQVTRIAGESQEMIAQRSSLSEKRRVLTDGLGELKRLSARHQPRAAVATKSQKARKP